MAPARGKPKEELLREEVRFWMDSMQKMMQWGVTLLIGLQTALFFLRRELSDRYIAAGELKVGQQLPYGRYLIGTGFLTLAAAIVWAVNRRSVQQYRNYKSQLLTNNESRINDEAPGGVAHWL